MNAQEPVPAGRTRSEEAPTPGAELHINLVAVRAGKLPASSGRRPGKDPVGISLLRRRIHAAVEAETSMVPEVSEDQIERELARIMKGRTGESSPGRMRRRHPLMALGGSRGALGLGSASRVTRPPRPDDQEPTAAAVLQIRLVPS